MIYVFLADGFEETEALVPIDILRRAGIGVTLVGVGGLTVTGSHGITVTAEISAEEVALDNTLDGVILPGGMPGTLNLKNSAAVRKAALYAFRQGRLIAAICAAPSALGAWGVLEGKRAVCYPGFEEELLGATICESPCVRDGNVITAKGAGVAFDFGFAIVDYLTGSSEKSRQIGDSMQCVR